MHCDNYQQHPWYVRICSTHTHTHKTGSTSGVGAAKRLILLHRPPALSADSGQVAQSPDIVETRKAT